MVEVTDTQSYVGKLVLVERANPTKDYSATYDGERLVYDATPNQLFTVDLANSYGGLNVYGLGGYSSSSQVPLFGVGKYNIVRVSDVPDRLWDRLDEVQKDIDDVKAGRKKAHWVESVYSRAEDNVERLKRLRDEVRNPPSQIQVPESEREVYRWSYEMSFSGSCPTAKDSNAIKAALDEYHEAILESLHACEK